MVTSTINWPWAILCVFAALGMALLGNLGGIVIGLVWLGCRAYDGAEFKNQQQSGAAS